MAVTITDLRDIWDEADATTGWTYDKVSVYTSDPDPIESTGCLGFIVSSETEYPYHTGTATNFGGRTQVFAWVLANGTMDTVQNGGIQIVLGDGTNRVGFHLAGSDGAAFRYYRSSVSWQCMVLDTAWIPLFDNTSYFYTEHDGTLANLDITNITDVGVSFKTLSKALGGVENCYVDILRYGSQGYRITGGTTSDRGTFKEISDADRGIADQQAYGILRELTTGVYGAQAPLTFGSTTTGDTWFEDDGIVLAFEDRLVTDDVYELNVVGSTSVGEETHFLLSNSTINTAAPHVMMDFSSTGIEELVLDTNLFSGLYNDAYFADDGYTHEITNNTFLGIGQIDPGGVIFTGNTISDCTNPQGAVYLDAYGTDNWSDLSFVSGGSGHGIYIAATGTFDFTRITFTGYGLDETTDACVWNNSGGLVTINVINGDTPTVRNTDGSTTTVNNAVTITINVTDEGGNVVSGAQTAVYKTSDDTQLMNEDTDALGVATETYNFPGNTAIYYRVRKNSPGTTRYNVFEGTGTITSTGFTANVRLIADTIASS